MNAAVLQAEEASISPATRQSIICSRRPEIGIHLLVVLGFAILTFFLTQPIPLELTTKLPGGGDAWQNIWNLWWAKHALLDLHTNPYHTDLLYYPDGVSLYFHTLVLSAGVLSIPLQLAGLNLIATYDLILLSTFVLAGYATYLLCYYLTGNRWASFVGGIVFAFSPYHFAHMFGHMNLVSLQWIPFYVLLLLKAMDADGWSGHIEAPHPNGSGSTASQGPARPARRALVLSAGAGALLAVNAYTDLTYAVFLTLLTALIVAWKVFIPSERRALAAAGVGWVEAGVRLTLLGVTFLLLAGPILSPTLAEAAKGYAQRPAEETLFYSADLVSAFMPNELHPVWGPAVARRVNEMLPYLPLKNPSERVLFVGYSVLLLAAVGAYRLRRNAHVRFWAFIALLMWLFSLGPVLQIEGKSVFTIFKVQIPLPYLILYKLPFLSIMRTPARITVLLMLALAILVAFTIAWLLPLLRLEHRVRPTAATKAVEYGVAFLIPLLILFEFLSTPFPTVPPGWNVPIYAQIAREPGRFALLELPLRPFGDYMAYQTIHGKPIIGGYLARNPPYPLEEQNAAVKYLLETTPASDPLQAQVAGGKGVQSLVDIGVKYIIIRWWAFTPEAKTAMQTKLAALLARSPDFTYPSDQVDVWQISP